MRDWTPFLRMNFLHAAVSSGVLAALRGGATRESLIDRLEVKRPELLDALLDMGTALKEFRCENGTYTICGKRSRTMVTPAGDTLAALVEANVTYYNDAYRRLGDRMRGAPLGEDLDAIGDVVARFSKIGEPILESFIRTLVGRSGPARVLDVGCGSGYVLKTAWQSNHKTEGIGIDIDANVVRQAQANLKQWDLPDRFQILKGDIGAVKESEHGRFDVITAFNLLYYMDPNHQPDFLRKMRRLLSPGGRLAIANNFESKGRDLAAANLNIVNTSLARLNPLPCLDTVRGLLNDCDFKQIDVTRFMPRNEFYGIVAVAGNTGG
jgi:SAM-dependent methyltransferase